VVVIMNTKVKILLCEDSALFGWDVACSIVVLIEYAFCDLNNVFLLSAVVYSS
jgi:hypothetical protein